MGYLSARIFLVTFFSIFQHFLPARIFVATFSSFFNDFSAFLAWIQAWIQARGGWTGLGHGPKVCRTWVQMVRDVAKDVWDPPGWEPHLS